MLSSAICSVPVCKIDYFGCVLRARSRQMASGRSGCAGVGLLWNERWGIKAGQEECWGSVERVKNEVETVIKQAVGGIRVEISKKGDNLRG